MSVMGVDAKGEKEEKGWGWKGRYKVYLALLLKVHNLAEKVHLLPSFFCL